nr:hypothetical protein [Tanacetum cinerariifolium]
GSGAGDGGVQRHGCRSGGVSDGGDGWWRVAMTWGAVLWWLVVEGGVVGGSRQRLDDG